MPRPSRLHVAEPAPSYAQRPAAVVDASVLCAIVFVEPELDEALARAGQHRLLAPHLLPYEVANVAVMKHRRGEPLDDLQSALQRFAALDLVLEPVQPHDTLDLAARYGITAYDAAYLWLAASRRAPLFTFDRRLADAARRHLGAL